MNEQFIHPLLPETTHDELARQNFVQSLEVYILQTLSPKLKAVYERVAKPQFEQHYQRSPQSRHEIRAAMQQQPYYQWWSAIRRNTQEMLWESVSESVERQLPELIEKAKDHHSPLGSLILDPDFHMPAHQTAVDIHCMPGGYHSEFIADDIAAGAVYDRGTYVYGAGWLGPLNDDMGLSVVENYLKKEYPNFQPAKILDLGCSVGHSTLPYVDGYPDAEVYAIDVSAPLLRYGHARAEALGKRVHFSQQNAESTNFPDQSFDLIVSHILLHEIPVPAIRKVMRECYRLLAPGGIMIHAEAPLYESMDLYTQFVYDWQTANNNEPHWSAMRDLDLVKVVTEAGFTPDQVSKLFIPNGVWRTKLANAEGKNADFGGRGTWFMIAACK